ncbi:LON peptidase substrate-binding domain-containing protein [Shewanella surugensis]|uniref:LON peptidase substrate-binding domain-containing protein n=1 Tax=Shewanella surugensis TaxID=212020 RepID=A0ABT0LH85_9GAMM|nr:LON peptidase substrate-binding domain-containing protein [Shewanella surugensis]MCL1126700.1 LON peptidase substrate-binding domain-containing protein [Shewanella surugensis]
MHTNEMVILTRDALLLPQGRTKVRIVEPHYLKMVAEVLKERYPLVYGMHRVHGKLPCYPYVTQCDVIDFDQQKDGALELVLEGRQKVKIMSAVQRKDKVWIAITRRYDNWQKEAITAQYEILSAALEHFFQANPELSKLYSQIHLDDATWVSQRWLEVLPLYNNEKLRLVCQPNCHRTLDYVLKLIQSHVNKQENSSLASLDVKKMR